MLDYYVAEMLHCVQDDPWISIPGIWKYITQGGPCVRPRGVMHLFGGMGQFKRTCRRLDVVRWAVIKHREDELPLGQEFQTSQEISERVRAGKRDEYTKWLSPDIWSIEPYGEEHCALEWNKTVCYRPSQEDSDDFVDEDSGDEAPTP